MPRAAGAAAIAGLIFVELIAAGALFQADMDRVYWLGRPLNLACSFKQATGFPCPGCGITRGIVLSIHGHLREAWSLSPSGPLVTIGLAALAICLSGYALFGGPRTLGWIRAGFFAYFVLAVTLWAAAWISTVWGVRAEGRSLHHPHSQSSRDSQHL